MFNLCIVKLRSNKLDWYQSLSSAIVKICYSQYIESKWNRSGGQKSNSLEWDFVTLGSIGAWKVQTTDRQTNEYNELDELLIKRHDLGQKRIQESGMFSGFCLLFETTTTTTTTTTAENKRNEGNRSCRSSLLLLLLYVNCQKMVKLYFLTHRCTPAGYMAEQSHAIVQEQ